MIISDPILILERLFQVAVKAADPMVVIPSILGKKPKGRVVVIGAGKASARMAEAVEQVWGACEGIILTRYGYARACKSIEIIEAAHPVPDENGILGTKRILELLETLTEDDFVLTLISGGGSALLVAPRHAISLSQKQQINQALLASGAPIDAMNKVRKHLSLVKGGQLAGAAYPAKMQALLISDVPGDDPAYIASGPTVGDDSSAFEALNILNKYNIKLPATISKVLNQKTTVLKQNSEKLKRVENKIISAPSQSLHAAQQAAKQLGFEVQIIGTDLEGEAAELGHKHALMALKVQKSMSKGQKPILILSGGECTVTHDDRLAHHKAIGGPNAEYILSAAISLDSAPNIYAIACDTDGVDGAAEIAGAVITPETLTLAKKIQAEPSDFLTRHDAHSFFALLKAQIITGPTLTNVNDFRAFIIYN